MFCVVFLLNAYIIRGIHYLISANAWGNNLVSCLYSVMSAKDYTVVEKGQMGLTAWLQCRGQEQGDQLSQFY